MTDKQKPPMAVWTGGHRTGFLATTTEPSDMTPDGPYVHLDQFIEEVEKRADRRAMDIANHMGGEYYTPDYYWAEKTREFAKELKEQNEN